MRRFKRITAVILLITLLSAVISGCSNRDKGTEKVYTYDEAIKELNAFNDQIKVDNVKPHLDIYDDNSTATTLADIDTFAITVGGDGDINIEIAAATELSAAAPDDWMNIVAKRFNSEGYTIDGKSVTVSIRKITSGEVLTYMTDGGYRPDVYAPSSDAWGKMLNAKGVNTITLADRIAGNTAGILMEKSTYNSFVEKYGEVTLTNVLEASIAGDLTFAYTNPYTSSTGLNILTAMLYAFDNEDPLSEKAQEKLLEYQKQSPPVAYTTGILRDQASKGIIKAMVMEEQAYVLNKELENYVYVPVGIRHDHPVFTFSYVSQEKQDAAKLFIDYCLTPDAQKLGTEKGFNRHEDYKGQDPGLDGLGYLAAQKLWKQNKTGGRPVIAVFVTDVSGSMRGNKLSSLKDALLRSAQFISSENYLGLVSYSTDVHVLLPIEQFDATQRATFSGAVKQMSANGGTAIYDATMVATQMLLEKQAELPDAVPVMFVLSDGHQEGGVNLSRILPIVKALKIPIYTIGFDMLDEDMQDMRKLSQVSGEADLTDAEEKDVVNVLRGLLNSRT